MYENWQQCIKNSKYTLFQSFLQKWSVAKEFLYEENGSKLLQLSNNIFKRDFYINFQMKQNKLGNIAAKASENRDKIKIFIANNEKGCPRQWKLAQSLR